MPMDGVIGKQPTKDENADAVLNTLGNRHVLPPLYELFHRSPLRLI